MDLITSYYITSCRLSRDTPLPTPTHQYNTWADDRKSLGITPYSKEGGKGGGAEEDGGFLDKEERKRWEEDQEVSVS